MNLIWYNRSKYYIEKVEDPKFFIEFKWINYDLGLSKFRPQSYVETYKYVTPEEIENIENEMMKKNANM